MGCAQSVESAAAAPPPPPSGANSQMPNELWDRYNFKRVIGDGASSTVYLASSKKDGSMVAVKTLLKSEVPEAKNWTSVFLQEVAMLKRLNHPNIVSFIESFSTPAEYVIVNQYLSGGQLFGRLGELTVYNEQVASRLAKQMFQALHFCHKNNIVHRDLKPANFVFSSTQPDAVLKLIDFGMAQLVESGWAYKGRIGTLYFMAPEIYDRHFPKHITDKVLKAADVWSMGVMLYLMLTGTEPFQEEHGKIIYTNITWPELPVLSESCKDLVSSMLALDFAERISTAEVLMHPWIDKSENNASRSLGVVVESLQDFSASKLMKKVVIGLLQKDASPDDETELQEVFEELDIDGDQRLDLTELTTYLHQHGFESKDEAEEIAKDLIDSFPDCKAKNSLDFNAFQKAHIAGKLGPEAAAIRKAYETFDTEKKGYIELIEIKSVLNSVAAKTFTELVKQVDKFTDGRITFPIFLAALTTDNLKLSANYAQGRLRGFMTMSTRSSFTSIHSMRSGRSTVSSTRYQRSTRSSKSNKSSRAKGVVLDEENRYPLSPQAIKLTEEQLAKHGELMDVVPL